MSIESSKNPILFACGVPRSGTTLLQRMLNSHPDVAVVNDSHFIPRALEKVDKSFIELAKRGEPIPLSQKLIDSVYSYHRFWRTGISRDEFDEVAADSRIYQELVEKIYGLIAQRNEKPFAGEKTPDYVRRIDLLHGLFPSAKLLHLVRDGRDVALSLIQWATPNKGPGRIKLWHKNPIAVCALWWRWMVRAAREQSTSIESDNYMEIRYEELVNDPSQEMVKACEFIGLPFSDSMLEFHKNRWRNNSDLSAKSAWLPPKKGLRNWRNDMSEDDIELFEVLAMDALMEFGYEVRNLTFSKRAIELGQQCERWWASNFQTPKVKSETNGASQQSVSQSVPAGRSS